MSSDHLYAGYESELADFRLAFSRGGAYTAILLVLSGVGLDYMQYRQELFPFAVARLLVAAAIGGIIFLLSIDLFRRHASWLTTCWLLVPQIMISWMIWATNGVESTYYVGLNLAIFASGIALPFGVWQNLAFGLLSCSLYTASCLLNSSSSHMLSSLVVNLLFLMFAVVASTVYTFFNERARFMLFKLKAEVSHKNRELEQMNRQLVEIKGQMLQQEKMAAIGTLAAGLMHEVNNPVNFCIMAIDIAFEELATRDEPTIKECLADAKQGMQRIQHIVSDLKTFAYRKPDQESEQVTPFLMEKALDSALRLAAHELRGVTITKELPHDTLVTGNDAAIIGVLINLLSNAALSMRKAGTAKPTIEIRMMLDGRRLRAEVRDNGPGIAVENLTRVFEPFFTTREVGQGLGLGLSISYAVIQRHGGSLYAESELGKWAAFSFDLPRAD